MSVIEVMIWTVAVAWSLAILVALGALLYYRLKQPKG